jgi:diadenosine tetraphosphate (Ap4A) HIT family hydrolase
MASVFTRIIAGEIPGRFVWRDEHVVAFLSINPVATGHVLVVPVEEVDHWVDLAPPLWTRVAAVSHVIGRALAEAFEAPRVGQMIAGFEVPHVHVHVFPAQGLDDIGFAGADPDPDPAGLDRAAERIRAVLRQHGHAAMVPATD